MNDYQLYIAKSRYAKWLPELNRREVWAETVNRYVDFWRDRLDDTWSDTLDEIAHSIFHLETVPSMRALMTAGPALDRDNSAGFNCMYLPIGGGGKSLEVLTKEMEYVGFDKPITIESPDIKCFDELMYLLLCGCGVGFSVERQYIANLPVVGHTLPRADYMGNNINYPGVPINELSYINGPDNVIHVADSKYGWASALRILLTELYNANFDIKWDVSKVRAAGSALETFGGRASGPEPLVELFNFIVSLFKGAKGRKLNSIECHDLCCKIASVVIVGGVRRAALISLSNLSDQRMAKAKSGEWYYVEPQRSYANNSIAFTEKPDVNSFMKEFLNIYESKSGERGIFNRIAAKEQASKRGTRSKIVDYGLNPCSEIILRPHQGCNLSEVIVRPTDTYESLARKVRIATIVGTIQSTLTDFRYLRPIWKKNFDEERLLGVSFTGIQDHPVFNGNRGLDVTGTWLHNLKMKSLNINEDYATKLGIEPSAGVNCIKPSGTVSQLALCGSGIHPWENNYFIRRVRADKKDPLSRFLREEGVPVEDDINAPGNTDVFSFPLKAPDGATLKKDMTAIEQLEHWLVFKKYWCDHNPSITVYVREDEWPAVQAWVWDHFDDVCGISFLPFSDHIYKQAPYEPISIDTYKEMISNMPNIDWDKFNTYEVEDNTTATQELACTGGACEI